MVSGPVRLYKSCVIVYVWVKMVKSHSISQQQFPLIIVHVMSTYTVLIQYILRAKAEINWKLKTWRKSTEKRVIYFFYNATMLVLRRRLSLKRLSFRLLFIYYLSDGIRVDFCCALRCYRIWISRKHVFLSCVCEWISYVPEPRNT